MAKIGDLRNISKEMKLEWRIKNFLRLPYNTEYISPEFYFCGISGFFFIYPNRSNCNQTGGWIDIYISATSSGEPISVDYSLHLKTVYGKADKYTGYKDTEVVYDCLRSYGRDKFISRSDLIRRQYDLLPSGILTIIFTLKKSDTDTIPGYLVDEFRQTEEGTGVLKLQEDLKEILANGNVSDVVLKVGGQEFKSHRCVLAARSPVFLAMMTHETKEKNTGVVDIQDIDTDTFSDFLRYLYTGSEEVITPESVVKLFTVADKYQVDELKKSCRNFMLKNISVGNFCDILNLSLVHVERNLTNACSEFFVKNSLLIAKTPQWLSFVTKNPVAGNELHIKQLENNMKMKNTN